MVYQSTQEKVKNMGISEELVISASVCVSISACCDL